MKHNIKVNPQDSEKAFNALKLTRDALYGWQCLAAGKTFFAERYDDRYYVEVLTKYIGDGYKVRVSDKYDHSIDTTEEIFGEPKRPDPFGYFDADEEDVDIVLNYYNVKNKTNPSTILLLECQGIEKHTFIASADVSNDDILLEIRERGRYGWGLLRHYRTFDAAHDRLVDIAREIFNEVNNTDLEFEE